MTGPPIKLDSLLPPQDGGALNLDSLLSSSTVESQPNYIAERLKGEAQGYAELAYGLGTFPIEAVAPKALHPDIDQLIVGARQRRRLIEKVGPGAAWGPEGYAQALASADAEIARLGEEAKTAVARRRYEQALGRAGMATPAQREITRFETQDPTRRFAEVLQIVSGIKDLPPNVDENTPYGPFGGAGPLAGLERTAIGLTSFPGHIIRAFIQAGENGSERELGKAIASATGTAGLFAAPFKARSPSGFGFALDRELQASRAADFIARGVTDRVASGLAQERALDAQARWAPMRDVKFTGDLGAPVEPIAPPSVPGVEYITMAAPARAHVGAEVRPGEVFRGPPSVPLKEAELEAIKQRLFLEEEGNITRTLLRAHRELTPLGTTVIAGVEQAHPFSIANAIVRGEELLQGGKVKPGEELLHTVAWYRPDGKADVAVYGDRSPLVNNELREEYRARGYFTGQEVSWSGRNFVVERFGPAPEELVTLRGLGAGEQHFEVPAAELRRPAYIASAEPFAVELHTRPYTVGDVMSITEQVDAARAGTPKGVQAQLFDEFIGRARGQETKSFTSGEPLPQTTGFQPGMNVVPLYDRYLELQQLFDNPGPETSLMVYADPNGQAVAFMEVGSLMNFGFPGTGAQIIKGVAEPVLGKHAAAVTGWMINPYAHPVLQARAALSLMERAHELGVSQLLAPVDEAGARLAARYMNRYFPKQTELRAARARVQEIAPTLDAMFSDFKQYHSNATRSAKIAARLSGIDLSKTKVVDATTREPLRMYHGTTKSFDQFDVSELDPGAMAGPGIYFTTDPRVATGYATSLLGETSLSESFRDPAKAQKYADARIREGYGATVRVVESKIGRGTFHIVDVTEPTNIRPGYLDIRNPFDWNAPPDPRFVEFVKQRYVENATTGRDAWAGTEEDMAQLKEDLTRFDDFTRGNPSATNEYLWKLVEELGNAGDINAPGIGHTINGMLREFGYDGIRYDGGKLIPQLDEAGKPILHDVWVAFNPKQVASPWVNGLAFDDIVKAYARESGFLPEEVVGLQRYFGQKMAKEGRELYLTPDEQALYTRLEKKMAEAHGGEPSPLQVLTELPRMPLDYLAVSNDMLADWTPDGVIAVRDRESGALLGRFRNEEKARDFINSSGQAEGPHLDGGGTSNELPPAAIGGSVMPPAPPRPPTNAVADGLVGPHLPPGNRIPRIIDWIRTGMEYFSPMEGWVSAIDNSLESNFSPGFRATQGALRRAQAPMLDFLKRLHKEVDLPFFKGLTSEQRAMVFRAIETMTPSQVIEQGFFRPLNSNEINIANWLAERHIDTARTLKYGRELVELEQRLGDDPTALGEATAEITKRYNLDADHTVAAATFNEIRKKDPKDIFIGHITRLADAIMSDAPSREEFVKEHNLPPNTLEAIRRLENILDEVANRVGVPDERRIRGWIAHFRAQMEPKGTLSQAFLGQRGLGNIPEMKFLNELARTGEISMVELDPVMAATRYIRGAFLSKEFIPTWNATLKEWKGELGKLPMGARQKVERVLSSYMSELRGIPEASVQFTDEVVRRMTSEMGMELSVDFRKQVVNTIIAASSAGTMAFRLAMGLRDFASASMVGTSWFGVKRFHRMLQLGWDDATVKLMHDKGLIPPSLTPIEFSSPVDLQTSLLLHKAPAMLNRIAEVGLKASLQPMVYDRLNAGAYLEAHELASSAFTRMVAGKIDKAAAYREMMIDAYEPSFVREFDKLVEGQKYEAAADLLGTQTQRTVTPTYGLANHPYKWGTNTGRLVGQFGTWTVWLATNMLRMTARGSAATRFGVLSRLAMTQAALYLTGKALGFDLYSWFLFTGLRWLGGPVVGTTRAAVNLFSPSQQEQAAAKLELARLVPSLSDPRSLYVPGSYALGDYLQAFGVLGDPKRYPSNPLEFAGRAIGIPVAKDPSWLDQLLGTQ